MASLQSDFFDFGGLFAQPPDCPYLPSLTLWPTFQGPQTSPTRS